MKFINIHTHHLDNKEDTISILNRFPDEVEYEGFFSVGIHPWYVDENSWKSQLVALKTKAAQTNCLAIGECGLDKLTQTKMESQIRVFEEQIKVSEAVGKPLIIHCVKAHQEVYNFHKTLKPKQVWVLHGFTKNEQVAGQLTSVGIKLSFGKSLLRNLKVQRTFAALKMEDFFLETDDADISIEEVYLKAAQVREVSLNQLEEQLQYNFNKVFKL